MNSEPDSAVRYLTTDEVARICRVHTMTVLRWIHAGKLPAKKAGHQYRITPADLDAFLEPK